MSNGSGCDPCFHHRNQEQDAPPRIIARCQTASFGSSGRVPPGETYSPSMAPGKRLPHASTVGDEPVAAGQRGKLLEKF